MGCESLRSRDRALRLLHYDPEPDGKTPGASEVMKANRMDVLADVTRRGLLRVSISSFSFHAKSHPVDEHGHGGAFVFDCRALLNPGRLAEYAQLTGLDAEVAAWLEQQPDLGEFCAAIQTLLTLVLRRYDERGFTDLSVAFGCTGGQHRSVNCAERLGRWLTDRGVHVTVRHLALEGSRP